MRERKISFQTNEIVLYQIQDQPETKTAVIIGTGNILDWRPMSFQEPIYDNCSIFAMYFTTKNSGLENGGRQVADFVSFHLKEYDRIFLVMHSKCGVMAVTSLAQSLKRSSTIIPISAPFLGTLSATPAEMKKRAFATSLSWYHPLYYPVLLKNATEYAIYRYAIFGDYPIDHDIALDQMYFLTHYDPSALENHRVINIIADMYQDFENKTFEDRFLLWLSKRIQEYSGDGVVSIRSQSELPVSHCISGTHATSLSRSRNIVQRYIDAK